MTPISRGFGGRRRDDVDPSRIPPGQYYERGFPVLSAGPTPRTPLKEWTFSIQGAVDEARSWTWDEFTTLPAEDVTVDIHCVTKWTKLDTRWKGVSVDTLLDGIETETDWVTAFADGDYTTNMGLEDVTDGRAWISYEYDGAPLDPSTAAPPGCSLEAYRALASFARSVLLVAQSSTLQRGPRGSCFSSVASVSA